MKEKKVKKLEMLSRVIKMYRIGTISAAIMLVVLCDSKVDAQDLHFSQFQMTPLQMDASMAGKQGDYRIILNYKDQWRSVANPYKTFGFSLETAFNKKHNKDHFFGMGLSAFRDQAGDIGMGVLELELSGAYHIKVAPKQYLSAGLQAGFGQKSLDESALRYGNQYDGSGHNSSFASNEILTNPIYYYPEFSLGVSYSSGIGASSLKVTSNNGFDDNKINAGIAMHHVPSFINSYLGDAEEKSSFRYVGHLWTSFGIGNTKLAIQPSGFFAYQLGATEFTAGSTFRYNIQEQSKYTGLVQGMAASVGAHYRTGDAFILSGLLEMGSFAVGASYDFNTSALSKVSSGRGGFEISLRYLNPNPFGGQARASFL